VTEFNYRIAEAGAAHVFVGVQLARPNEAPALARAFRRAGFPALDLTHDELAKLHLRHLVGGRSPLAAAERLFRFEFPERPGALMQFLSTMPSDWNISLFHYRNQGADYGRVLVGLQVPSRARRDLRRFVEALGYRHWDESDNPAYRLFLR
jgi:threonine dehydratase